MCLLQPEHVGTELGVGHFESCLGANDELNENQYHQNPLED